MGNCLKPKQQLIQVPNSNQKRISKLSQQKGLTLIIKCWKQTHNNLFNFNLSDVEVSTQVINVVLKKLRVIKLGNQYQALFPQDPQFSKVMPPVMIDVGQLRQKDKYGQRKYSFLINEFPKISKPFWLAVKSLPNQRYQLKQGDIFKMGKIKIRVKQIIHKNSQTKQMNKQIEEAQFKVYHCEGNECVGINKINDFKCRICMEQGENSNPLIALCDCIGGSKYSHFKCLRKWFTTQLDPTRINMVTQINWKSLECELCRAKLPYSISLDNQTYFLVEFPKIKKPYLVLNPVYKSNNQKSKIYYFISFKKRNRMIVGRKSDADIQLCTDATISRHHSVINYIQTNPNQNGKFYLEDNKSKFGTVVLLNTKAPITVDPRLHGVQFQVGGDLIKINYKTQTFFHSLSTQQNQLDFNNGAQFQSHQFQQDDDGKIEEQNSQQDKKASTKQQNNQISNSFEDNSQTNSNFLKTNKKKVLPKIKM